MRASTWRTRRRLINRNDSRTGEQDRYLYTHLAAHLKQARENGKLFQLMEDKGFLIDQAAYAGGFLQGTRDVERYVLPAIIERADWLRFLRYALVAINFRGLAEALAEERILRALVRHGDGALARSLVSQLSDPRKRARARAVILGARIADSSTVAEAGTQTGNGSVDSTAFAEELRVLRDDLDSASPPTTRADAESWFEVLSTVARHLPPAWLRDRWSSWVQRLDSESRELARKLRQIVAECWLEHDLSSDAGLWQYLEAIGDPKQVRRLLTSRLARSSALDDVIMQGPLPVPFDRDDKPLWHARVTILGRLLEQGRICPDDVLGHLERMPTDWSAELVAAARRLWPNLAAEHLAKLLPPIKDPHGRAELLILLLENRAAAADAKAARAAVEVLESDPRRLHLCLRYLAAPEVIRRGNSRRLLRWAVRHLEACQYRAPAADLARFLDLIAKRRPRGLPRQTERMIWAPTTDAGTLIAVVAETQSRSVLDHLFENAERYAAVVARAETASFGLRRDLLIRITVRCCDLWGDISAFDRAVQRLLPEEEDQLRMAVVESLVTVESDELAVQGPLGQARALCEGIRSRRLRLLARLRIPADEQELGLLLEPQALYRAVAQTEVAEDELLALEPLRQVAIDPQALSDQFLAGVRSVDRHIQSLIDLAGHAQRLQKRAYSPARMDLSAALQPLILALGGVTSDRLLAHLTPRLVEVGAAIDTRQAVVELQEAFVRVLGLETVDWSQRVEILEMLILSIAPLLLQRTGDRAGVSSARCRAAAKVFLWLAALPRQWIPSSRFLRIVQPTVAVDEWRRRWQELLPILVAAAESLPRPCQPYLRPSLLDRVGWRWRPRAVSNRGWVGRADGLARWLAPDQLPLFEAYLRSPRDLQAELLTQDRTATSRQLTTSIYLLSGTSPQQIPSMLDRLPPGEKRDRLVVRLIRNCWLHGEPAALAAERIHDAATSRWAELWLTKHRGDGRWPKILASLVVRHGLDPLEPCCEPLRQALREYPPAQSRQVLARAVTAALASGGRNRGEQALRWWLYTYPSFEMLWAPPTEPGHRVRVATVLHHAKDVSSAVPDDCRGLGPERDTPEEARRLFRVNWECLKALMLGARKKPKMLEAPFRLAFRIGFFAIIPLAALDLILLDNPRPVDVSRALVLPAIGLLPLLFIANAVLIDRYLAWSEGREDDFRPAVRRLRFLLAGVPVLGLWTVVLWRWLIDWRPRWALQKEGHDASPPAASLPLAPKAVGFTRLGTAENVTLLLAGNAIIAAFCFVIAILCLRGLVGRIGLFTLAMFYHVSGFGLMFYCLWVVARNIRLSPAGVLLLCALALFWLVPIPLVPMVGALAAIACDMFLPPLLRVERGLLYRAYEGGRGYSRLALRMGLGRRLRRVFPSLPIRQRASNFGLDFWRRQGRGRVERYIFWLYRIETFFLPFEAAFVAYLALKSTESGSESVIAGEVPVIWLARLTLILGIAGFVLNLFLQTRDWKREPNQRMVIIRAVQHFSRTQLALAAGLWAGSALAFGIPAWIAALLELGGISAFAVAVFSYLLAGAPTLPDASEEDDYSSILWAPLFLLLALCGAFLTSAPETADVYLPVILATVQWCSGLGILVSCMFLPWLLRPFSLSEILSAKAPASRRWLLAVLAVTAILPLSGLAIPVWICLRHSRWPELEREWLKRTLVEDGPLIR